MRVREADWFHRPVAQRVWAALGHDLDGQATLEIGGCCLKFLECRFFAGKQRREERLVLRFIQRAVDVVGAASAWPDFVVARLEPTDIHIDGLAVNDRRDGVEKRKLRLTGQRLDRGSKRGRGEGTGGDDDVVPSSWWKAIDLPAYDLDEPMRLEFLAHLVGKTIAVDCQGTSGRQLVRIGGGHDQRAGAAHL